MENIPKPIGRGQKLLEKIRSRESENLSERADELPFKGEKQSPQRTPGRGNLSRIRSAIQASEELPEVGVASSIRPEGSKKGRGFLAELAKQSRIAREVTSAVELPHPRLDETKELTIQKPIQKLSIKDREDDTDEPEKPPVIKKGVIGEKIDLTTNYVTLKTEPGKGVFEYTVKFSPDIDYVAYRYQLINQHFEKRKGIRCYDGHDKLFMPEKISTDNLIIDTKHPNDDSPIQIIISYKLQKKPKDCSHLYNVLLNNCSKVLELTRLGRQFYDFKAGLQIPQHRLEIWPGYVTSVEEFEGGIHLCCDIRHRVLRTDTAYDAIVGITKHDTKNYQKRVAAELLGQCVLTRYNNNLYRIDDIEWSLSPLSTFKLSSGEDISFLEYYKKQYNLQIKDLNQPLLIHKPRKKRLEQETQLICLVPELCNLTGLTDRMRKDMRVMKEIAAYTRVTPNQRHLAFKKYLENLRSSSQAQKMLNDWGLILADEPLVTEGRILPQEDVVVRNGMRYPTPANLEWSKYLRNCGVFRGISIRHWLLVHTLKDSSIARSFWNMLLKVGPGLGVDICDPNLVPLADDRIDSYITGIRNNVDSNTQMIVCLCPTAREDRYSAIKKLCCHDIPIPSQVVNCPTVSRENRMRSIVQNIALQMNNKVGGASWSVTIPLKNTMICGIDSYHDKDGRGCSVGAFVASVDSNFTRWFSKTCIQEPKQELVDGLICCFAHSLKKYLEINNILPERIVIFRDGVGDGQLPVVQNHEVGQFLETCERVSKQYKPKFSFIVVQKRINTKLYQLCNGSSLENPKPGSVLDHTITRRNFYDFFLVSQFVSCGTATPSHYIVLYDTSELKPDLMQRLTYKCCHLYYNWPGTIRVPAPCQYAHKLAYLVGENVRQIPKDILDDKLYYL